MGVLGLGRAVVAKQVFGDMLVCDQTMERIGLLFSGLEIF